MKIEAVIICKDYSDFLEHTLPNNIQFLDHVVVVTHHTDKATRALCSRYSIDCVDTHEFFQEGAPFNKGRAINVGLAHLKGLDYILHMDADILLPHRFRNLLDRANLQPKNLYGADRVNVYGFDRFHALKDKLVPHYSHRYFVQPPAEHPVGARIIHHEFGYCPIGYFQLWHKSAGRRYPINQGTAEHTDVLFAIQWERQQRVLLPEVVVYHLDSHEAPPEMGGNWNGRTSPPFAPKKKDHDLMMSLGGGHHDHHDHHPYKPKPKGEQ